jgi:hypothetical protein
LEKLSEPSGEFLIRLVPIQGLPKASNFLPCRRYLSIEGLAGLERLLNEVGGMRSRVSQRMPVWLQSIVVVVCAAAMVIAADALAGLGTAI